MVTIDGAPAFKAATQVSPAQAVVLSAAPRAYVSRGGDKLAHALSVFGLDPTGWHVLDAGVSTGGFTDCLLQHGAARVVAYDVGYGQLHERLRTDERVVLFERTNVRSLTPADVPPPPADLLVADLSFISLALVLPTLRSLVAEDGQGLVLVKPQFEAERGDVGTGGIVRDPAVWARSLHRVATAAASCGWETVGATASPLLGGAGNVEFLLHLAPPDTSMRRSDTFEVGEWVATAVAEGQVRRADGRGAASTDTDAEGTS